MILFLTTLDIGEFVTQEDFIKLVLEWNAGSRYEENIVKGIEWCGERTVRYGDSKLWLEFVEYAEREILAVRHEKITADGVVWDSDFVMNFGTHRLTIQLDRTYSEEALVMGAYFSTPHFITLLIEKGFLAKDRDLPVLRTPIAVTDVDLEMCKRAFTEDNGYRLPVVFVSRTAEDKFPLSITWLASRLKGAAHVLVEESAESCAEIRKFFKMGNEPFGAVRIYYPLGTVRHKKFRFRSATGNEDVRLEKVIRHVIQYGIAQRVERFCTWNGVNGAVLNNQLDHQIAVRKERVAELMKANEALQYENQGLRAKYASSDAVPLLYFGDEEEFYEGEIRDMVLGVLDEALAATEKATRKGNILEDVLENNVYQHLSDERKQKFLDVKTVSEAFTHHETRIVDKAGCFDFGGRKYEATAALSGMEVEIAYDPLNTETVMVRYGKMDEIKAHPVRIGAFADKKPERPVGMTDALPETSRFLDALEKKYREDHRIAARALSFGEYGKTGDR